MWKHDSWVCTRWQAKVLKNEELSFAKLSDWLWDIPHLLAKGHGFFPLLGQAAALSVWPLTSICWPDYKFMELYVHSPPHTFKVWLHFKHRDCSTSTPSDAYKPSLSREVSDFRVTMTKTRVFWTVIMIQRVPDVSKVRVAIILKNDQITFSCFIRSHSYNAGSKMGCPASCSSVTHSHSC
jgi:hypothetical protein